MCNHASHVGASAAITTMITIRRTRDNRETMKRDNSFPMAMNYRINSQGSLARSPPLAKLLSPPRPSSRPPPSSPARSPVYPSSEINFSALSQNRLLLDRIEFCTFSLFSFPPFFFFFSFFFFFFFFLIYLFAICFCDRRVGSAGEAGEGRGEGASERSRERGGEAEAGRGRGMRILLLTINSFRRSDTHARAFVARIKSDKSQRVRSIGRIIGTIFRRAVIRNAIAESRGNPSRYIGSAFYFAYASVKNHLAESKEQLSGAGRKREREHGISSLI